jgi:hypothetical protein
LEQNKIELLIGQGGPKVIEIIVDPDVENWGTEEFPFRAQEG